MKYVNPIVEYWQQNDNDINAHIARCARVCYASEKNTDNDRMVEGLIKNGHLSMLRHASYYYIIHNLHAQKAKWIIHFLQNTPYASVYVVDKKTAFISANGQFVYENKDFINKHLGNNAVSLAQFLYEGKNVKGVRLLVRHTVCVTTQVSTSRELNRVSPNNIAEQSTRYVNFGRKGGVTVCRPWWLVQLHSYTWWASLVAMTSWHLSAIAYRLLLRLGMKPQDARGVLPLDVATRVVYTYTGYEWDHILDLRLRGTTGAPHPNAKVVAKQIKDLIDFQVNSWKNIGK